MKKRLFALSVCLLFLFVSCGKTKDKQPDENAELTLSLYCTADNLMVDQYILAFEDKYKNVTVEKKVFDDTSQFDETLANELNGGKGPDVVLFTANTSLDVMQMAKNGAFASLNSYLDDSEDPLKPENYIASSLDAGKIGEEQYLLPLSVAVPFLWYNTGGDPAFENQPVLPFETFQSVFYSETEKYQNETDQAAFYCGSIVPFLYTSGVFTFSEDREKLNYDEAQLKGFLDFLKDVQTDYRQKGEKLVRQYGTSFIDILNHFQYTYSAFGNFVYMAHGLNAANQTIHNSEIGISALTEYGSDTLSAYLGAYGAVNKNAGEKTAYACDFLRMSMDYTPKSPKECAQAELSVNKYSIYEQITMLKGNLPDASYEGIQIHNVGLSDKLAQDLTNITDSIQYVEIPNPKIRGLFTECFTSYLEGKGDYEACLTDFEQRVNLYLTE